MKRKFQQAWPYLKIGLILAIAWLVGQQFYQSFTKVDWDELTLRPTWIALACFFYVAGLGCSGWYWLLLLRFFSQDAQLFPSMRAYYVSHLGKYIPGKAVALLMRGGLITSPKVDFTVAILCAFYEVLTTMAAGALVGSVIFAFMPVKVEADMWHPMWLALLLAGVAGVPLCPIIFNTIVGKLAKRFQKKDQGPLPKINFRMLLLGLAVTSLGWCFLGLSFWATVQSVTIESVTLDWQNFLSFTGAVSISYVAGFLVIFLPGGMLVRESLLLLVFPNRVTAIGLLRVIWTAVEIIVSAGLYWWPGTEKPVIPGVSTQIVGQESFIVSTTSTEVTKNPNTGD